jgi:pimeloyl-ACP methyl ester carboxylesterase
VACTPPDNGNETVKEVTKDSGTGKEPALEPKKEPVQEPVPDGGLEPVPDDGGSSEKVPESSPERPALPPGPAPPTPGPAAPKNEAKEVQYKEYLLGIIPSTMKTDPVRAELNKGTFAIPAPEATYLGIKWSRSAADGSGKINGVPRGFNVYAAFKVTVPEDTYAYARADSAYMVYLNNQRQPGDVYSSGRYRIPIRLKKGDNSVVMRLLVRNKAPVFKLWTTPHELTFNASDLTAPMPVVGDSSEQCVGLQVVNHKGQALSNLIAEVTGNEHFELTRLRLPSLPMGTTQVAFRLKPKKKFATPDEELSVRLRLYGSDLKYSYTYELKLKTIKAGEPYRLTRISGVDNSCQFAGVRPPDNFDPKKKYALVLSLHGAGVNALGQVRAYSSKDWAYIVAPTNRRPFGFDWEVWGRLDGLEVLSDAKKRFNIDPTKVYVTGHSMGGHGTWQFSVLFPGRFAVAGPSAGWSSFYSYTGRRRPTGPFARSQASSATNNYLSNLAKRGVYVIHGDKDNNVPVREGRDMVKAVKKYTNDVKYHEQPGAGHWWNGPKAKGTDCVDWPEMFDFMKARRLDPFELDFSFKTPGSWVSDRHSYVRILTQKDINKDASLTSKKDKDTLKLSTDNVRGLVLNGKALQDKGIKSVDVDGKSHVVSGKDIPIGPQDGKKPGQHGPFNEVMHRPFCFVYETDGSPVFAEYAAYLVTSWTFIGNGHACSVPFSKLNQSIDDKYNLIYIGVSTEKLKARYKLPFGLFPAGIRAGSSNWNNAAVAFVFPDGKKLAGFLYTTKGSENLLYTIMPFTSSFVLPDYFVWTSRGGVAGGFFNATWSLGK